MVMAAALAVAVIVLVVLVTLTVTGDDDEGPTAEDKAAESAASAASVSSSSAEAEASRSAELQQAREDRIARQQAEYDECKRLVGGFLNGVKQIDSRLAVGLNYDEYGDYLGDTQVEYDEFVDGINQDNLKCTRTVGLPLERAYRKYLRVLQIWGDCIDDYYCDFSTGETNRTVQDAWAEATQLIDKADRSLENLAPSP